MPDFAVCGNRIHDNSPGTAATTKPNRNTELAVLIQLYLSVVCGSVSIQ
jgi:hypothetical protein